MKQHTLHFSYIIIVMLNDHSNPYIVSTAIHNTSVYLTLYSPSCVLKGNGAVYKDLNLARVSRRTINRHVTC